MKKNSLFVLMFMLFIASISSAKTSKYIELGINKSKFRNVRCESKKGWLLSFGADYFPIKTIDAFIGTGLMLQNKRILTKNRTRPSNSDPYLASFIITRDTDINIFYLELPVHIGYSIKINQQLKLNALAGVSYAIPVYNNTKVNKTSDRQLSVDEIGNIEFDDVFVDENYTSGAKNYHIGMRVCYLRFAFSLFYSKALSVSTGVDEATSLQGEIDNISLTVSYIF